jgi:hypothetical protein
VVPGDHASAVATLPAGTYPAWSQDTQYQVGNKVLYQGRPYQAKWVNQGVSPATESTDPSGSAWKALYSIPGEPSGGAGAWLAGRLVGLLGRERQPVPRGMTVKSKFNTRQLPNDCGLLWPPHRSLMSSRRTRWRTVTCHPLSFRRPVRQAPHRPRGAVASLGAGGLIGGTSLNSRR